MPLQVYKNGQWRTPGLVVDFKYAVKTDTQTINTGVAGSGTAGYVSDLTINHAVSKAGNLVVLRAIVHGARGERMPGLRFAIDSVLDSTWIGDAAGSRLPVTGQGGQGSSNFAGESVAEAVFVTTDTTAHDYQIYAYAMNTSTDTSPVYINRTGNDSDAVFAARHTSWMMLWEIDNG